MVYTFCSTIYFPTDIWLLGDSIIYWAGVYAAERNSPNLNLPSQWSLGWYGIRGMSWSQFVHTLQLRVLFQTPPKVILVHLGGNDLCTKSLLQVFNLIRNGLNYLLAAYPDVHYIWVDILQRLHWTSSYQGDVIIERKRQRTNRFGRSLVATCSKGHSLVHDIDIHTPGFFRNDGIHLSNIGLAMYLDATRDKLLSLI